MTLTIDGVEISEERAVEVIAEYTEWYSATQPPDFLFYEKQAKGVLQALAQVAEGGKA